MISQFFILSVRGNTLVFRDFRSDVVRGSAEIFYRRVKSYKGGDQPPPVLNVEGTQFLFIMVGGLYFVCSSSANVSPVFVFEFLNRIAHACKDYCGSVDEEAVVTNFTLLYEIVDEMLDYGYPQCTSTEGLRDFIVNDAHATSKVASGGGSISSVNTTLEKYNHIFGVEKKSVPSSAANKPVLGDANSSRKNEVYIDILERLTVTFASAGNVVCSDIDGCVKVRSYLAGDPEIQMLLNDVIRENGDDASYVGGSSGLKQGVSSSVVLDDCRFHECVDTEEFNRSATLIFRPPAGESIVMKYHTTGQLHLPFRVYPILETTNDTQLKLQIKISCDVPKMHHAVAIKLSVPVPKSTTGVAHDSSTGANKFEYISSGKQKHVEWMIPRMNGGQEHHACIRITVPAVTKMCTKELSPLSLDFEFPMYVCSKLEIKSLKVQERNAMYTAQRWVRYITHSDSYVVRL